MIVNSNETMAIVLTENRTIHFIDITNENDIKILDVIFWDTEIYQFLIKIEGIILSQNEKTLYVVNSDEIYSFDLSNKLNFTKNNGNLSISEYQSNLSNITKKQNGIKISKNDQILFYCSSSGFLITNITSKYEIILVKFL